MVAPANIKTGDVFGRLVVQKEGAGGRNPDGSTFREWICLCACEKQVSIRTTNLTSGKTNSCGCLQREGVQKRRFKHGQTSTLLYGRWQTMLTRCTNPNSKSYATYGKAGINVCERWLKFENFLMDMGQPKKNQTLERVDNTLGYSPENCRWATRAEQSRNRTDNVYLNVGPEKLVAADAVKLLAVTRSALHQRMKRKNETMQQAFNYYYKDIQQKKKLLGVTRAQQTLTLHGVE